MLKSMKLETVGLLLTLKKNVILVLSLIGAFLLPIKFLLILTGIMVFLDTIMGVYRAYKLKEKITSNKLSNVVSKMVLYQSSIILIFIIEKYLLGEFVSMFTSVNLFCTKLTTLTLIFIELKSLLESYKLITGVNIWNQFKELLKRGKELKNNIGE